MVDLIDPFQTGTVKCFFIYVHIVLFGAIITDVMARLYWSCILSEIAFRYTEIKIVRVFGIKIANKFPTNMPGVNAIGMHGMGTLHSLDSIYK